MKKTILALTLALAPFSLANAQILLSGTSYSENFNGIAGGLPTGVTVFTGATASSNGTASSITGAALAWSDTGGAFKNFAASTGLAVGSTAGEQSASTDRALGIRQTGGFGDPGAAFVFTLANTTGYQGFSMSLDLMMLSVQTRSTVFTIDFRIGGTGSFTSIGSFNDSGAFGNTPFNFNFGSSLDNQSGIVEIRVVALSASTGAGSRDSVGIDNFNLSYTAIPEPSTVALGLAGLAGLVALRRRK